MSEPDPDAWKETTTARERVRHVVDLLDDPATVTEIADAADVAWETADSELERLLEENRVAELTVEGQTKYGPNHVRQLLDQVLALINEHERGELEDRLLEYQSRVESLQEDYDANTLEELRRRLTEEDLTADEMQELRNAASSWDALQTELRLIRHALQLYDDVQQLSTTGTGVVVEG